MFVCLKALLGFERWQSTKKGLPLRSVKDNLGSIGDVEASRIEVALDGISPSSFGATSWYFPTMNYWVEVIGPSYRVGGWHAMEMSEPAVGDVIGRTRDINDYEPTGV